MRRRRTSILWRGATAHENRPRPREVVLPAWLKERPDALTVGTLFAAVGELGHLNALGMRTEPPRLARLVVGSGSDLVVVPASGLLVYAGTVRFDERKGTRVVSVPHHTFVHGSGRYVISDLEQVRPV